MVVRRLVKEALSQVSPDADFNIHEGTFLAFCESGRIFIHYLRLMTFARNRRGRVRRRRSMQRMS
ncbi:hypothetical protein LINGRAHAP2_LOCUS29905 [Linum grandiflorum]